MPPLSYLPSSPLPCCNYVMLPLFCSGIFIFPHPARTPSLIHQV